MANIHIIEDANGDAIEHYYYCSDFCHRLDMGDKYDGWHGCVELHAPENCKRCNRDLYYYSPPVVYYGGKLYIA